LQYYGQLTPQPAFVELICRGEGAVSAGINGDIGAAVPMYVWQNLAVRWVIPPETTGPSLKALFEEEYFLDLCKRILSGFEEVWDGSNYVGRFSEDAASAIGEAGYFIDQQIVSILATKRYADSGGVTVVLTDWAV